MNNQYKQGYNPYLILGYKTIKGGLPNEEIEEVSDEAIKTRYENIKANIMDEFEKGNNSGHKEEQLKKWINTLETAYNELSTEEKREKHNEPLLRKKQLKTMMGKLISNEGGDVLRSPEKTEINKQNRAIDVRKNQNYLEYTPEYEDENVRIIGMEEILFNNGTMYNDSIKKYMLVNKEDEQHLMQGIVSFYSVNTLNLSDKEHRIALYQAIKKAGEENNHDEKYIGAILKKEDGKFEERRDGGQIDAMLVREKQKEIERKKGSNEKNQPQDLDGNR